MEEHQQLQQRRLSCGSANSSRRTSICSNRIAEIPVENIVQQTKVDTLQWQLKEIEKSREMYKALMKQVVTFLEKAHRSLELIGNKMNSKNTVSRSKSEHQIVVDDDKIDVSCPDDYSVFRDYTWRRPKKPELLDEIPPEKLSKEAFRLLRTAQSLLSLQEPKLTPVQDEPEDIQFLAQLAKEFPREPPDAIRPPQRTPSFSLSPKLLLPDTETQKISTAFNRKLSLQLNESRRYYKELTTTTTTSSAISHHQVVMRSCPKDQNGNGASSYRNSFVDLESGLLSSTMADFAKDVHKPKFKSTSPPGSSISSMDDESGFSSMNSFQEVGIPAISDEVTTKNALLRSMLHNTTEQPLNISANNNSNSTVGSDTTKLWQKPEVAHKRWSSTPVERQEQTQQQNLKVLWV